MIRKAQGKGHIAIDDGGHALQEYNDCCKPSAVGLNLCDWIADQIVNKVIVMFTMDRSIEDDLRKLGLPKKDYKWPAIAKGSEADTILTEDIDLFHPEAKGYNAKAKAKIRERGGCVSKFLARNDGISVTTAENFLK